ncbi:Pyridoxine/pyridoxamine 5'-phosphate oxidase [Gemmatirosa kalamazoonensis]|uniref:Pyridoxamine 5'-phosphate oxidase n=1 Tax=Gemmatirosa kalamazoonensis TaxID=861299 RepID=W0RLR3_9BACT|nr:pyridoxamine 5'-phosphate oxidase [Gemmatirosa kalamazoonensis]AHG92029.1 Pyridoxine/pyridoxamine 5'-phosphate oxidase [Gemmatirosa kalamazoonensis]
MSDPSALDLSLLRRTYARAALGESDVADDPIAQFAAWFAEAQHAQVPEPNGMTLATATPDGRPSARVVLLKSVDARGFVFFCDYRSRKGQELDANARAALAFWWEPLERQVRVEGRVERASREESAAYFATRPRGSRLGAWTSRQSSVLPDRAALERELAAVEQRFAGVDDVPLPDHWGGFRVVPDAIEFWQGRPDRLHDRIRYRLTSGGWTLDRLSP